MYLKLTCCELPEVDTAAAGRRAGDGRPGGGGKGTERATLILVCFISLVKLY
jgi:hypothetical protein